MWMNNDSKEFVCEWVREYTVVRIIESSAWVKDT